MAIQASTPSRIVSTILKAAFVCLLTVEVIPKIRPLYKWIVISSRGIRRKAVLDVRYNLSWVALVRFGGLEAVSEQCIVHSSEGEPYLNLLTKSIIKVQLPSMDNILIPFRLHRNMNMHSTTRIVSREDRIKVHSAKLGRRLVSTKRTRIGKVVLAAGISVPCVHASILDGATGGNVDDLHSQTEVDALLARTDILTARLTIEPEGTVDGFGCQSAASSVLVALLAPLEAPDLLGIAVLAVMLVRLLKPLFYIFLAW